LSIPQHSLLIYALEMSFLITQKLFSPLGKLAERAIYFTFRNFFLFFKLSKAISGSTGPIFTIFSPSGRYLCEGFKSGPVFPIP